MRVLGAVRESLTTEESVSTVKQESQIRAWARANGHEVVRITVDKSVSGKVDPARRPELGPWLTEPAKLAQWDILAGAKLDRISRSTLGFARLIESLGTLGKACVALDLPADFATPEGEMQGSVMMAFAQFERRRIGQRRKESGEIIRASGRWNGGRIPFGYQPERINGGWRLEPHDTNAAIARGMVADAIAGVSVSEIARRLDAAGVPTSASATWRDNSVRRILRSPALMGHATRMRGGMPVTLYDDTGQPVAFTGAPLIDAETFRVLQRTLEGRARSRGQAQARHTLWGVAFCGECSGKLYGHRRHKHEGKGNYYACRTCPGMSARLEDLDDLVTRLLIADAGDRVVHEQRVIPGDDHAGEIVRAERRAERLRAELADEHDDDLASALGRMERRIDALRADHVADRLEWVPVESGETVAQMWARLEGDTEARNKVLRDGGARLWLHRDGSWRFRGVTTEADGDRFLSGKSFVA